VKLNLSQRAFARVGLLAMGLSVLFGVVAIFCDARRCYNLARHIQASVANETTLADAFHSRYIAYFRSLTLCNWIQRLAFLTGIAATVIYTFSLVT
ncbi:MAG TPA: hypothetical protein VGO27_21510, partial [Candidatus Acidoferrum sp.]|nr:hypothetical protein [Candidatus Acidoferrum sp.]